MKKILYILIAISLSSCKDFLDVKPTGGKILESVEDYDKLLNYYQLANLSNYENLIYKDPDMALNNQQYGALGASGKIAQKQYTWSNDTHMITDNDWDWNSRYSGIGNYNEVLDNIDAAPLGNVPASKRTTVKGEALANRAFNYFVLISEYAPHYSETTKNQLGIPLPLKVDLKASLGRSTVGEVYTQILNDLLNAEALLAPGPARNDAANFRPAKASVKGLLAWVYLYMGDFAKARTYSDEALSLYSTLNNYNSYTLKVAGNPWNGLTGDPIKYSTDNLEELFLRGARTSYKDALLYSADLEAQFDKTNDRRWVLFNSHKDYFNYDASPAYFFALGEVGRSVGVTVPQLLLINAEAKARTTDANGAITALNKLRSARYTPAKAAYTGPTDAGSVLKEIKLERRREFVGTGLNVIDLKRYAAYGDNDVPVFTRTVAGTTYTLEPGSSKYVAPIAPKVKSLNPNL